MRSKVGLHVLCHLHVGLGVGVETYTEHPNIGCSFIVGIRLLSVNTLRIIRPIHSLCLGTPNEVIEERGSVGLQLCEILPVGKTNRI